MIRQKKRELKKDFLTMMHYVNSNAKTIEIINETDLLTIFKLADKQQILPLVYYHIARTQELHANAYPKIFHMVLAQVSGQNRRTEVFKSIYEQLIISGIKPIVLKGLVCRALYGELADYRPSCDEDIYIQKQDYICVKKILLANGFYISDNDDAELDLENIQEITFYEKKSGMCVEVHLNAIGKEYSYRRKMNQYFTDSFQKMIQIDIEGKKYYTLDYTQNYIFMFLHYYKHFLYSGIGIRQLVDLLKFEEKYMTQINWLEVEHVIKKLNGWQLFGDMRAIGNIYMGFNLPKRAKSLNHELLLTEMMESGVFGNASIEHAYTVEVSAVIRQGGLAAVIFPNFEWMKKKYPKLEEHRWMLPLMWWRRIMWYICKKKISKPSVSPKQYLMAREKKKLLKNYGMIKMMKE